MFSLVFVAGNLNCQEREGGKGWVMQVLYLEKQDLGEAISVFWKSR